MKVTAEQLHERMRGVHARMHWIADDDERTAWVNCAITNCVMNCDWDKLVWQLEDVLDQIEASGGRAKRPHSMISSETTAASASVMAGLPANRSRLPLP